MLLALIIACEIAFWLFIAAGLVLRYPLRRPRAGLVAFALTPVVDLVLLTLTTLDLRAGGEPSWVHTLAAFYIGFSLLFGHDLIRWADRQYRVRVLGEAVAKPEPSLRREAVSFVKAVGAVGLALVAVEVVIAVSGNPAAEALRQARSTGALILLVWAISGPVWQLFSPRAAAPSPERERVTESV